MRTAAIFDHYDANTDGRVSVGEMHNAHQELKRKQQEEEFDVHHSGVWAKQSDSDP